MQFYDSVQISVSSGKGGDGVIAGRREKCIPFGGPAGGDGGMGGSVYIEATNNEWTLMPYRHQRKFVAPSGEPGQSKDKYGKGAEDVVLLVPIGTLIRDTQTQKVLVHFTQQGQRHLISRGGRGGAGNMHFANASVQYPHIALLGEPGETKEIILELQLLADVALIGTPSVGKSSLINVLAGTRLKTAPYPFTTITPHVGIVSHKGDSWTVIDIPGLIAGAHEGKGLGNIFLRHILKARCFAIMVDISKEQAGIDEIDLLLEEIRLYIDTQFLEQPRLEGHIQHLEHHIEFVDELLRYTVTATTSLDKKQVLLRKAILFVVNKIDIFGLDEQAELWHEYLTLFHISLQKVCEKWHTTYDPVLIEKNTLPISALSRSGIDQLLDTTVRLLSSPLICTYSTFQPIQVDSVGDPYVREVEKQEIDELVAKEYLRAEDLRYIAVWEISHPEIAYLTFVLPRGNTEAELWFRNTLEKKRLLNWIRAVGVRKGDVLKIVSPYTGHPPKYLMRD